MPPTLARMPLRRFAVIAVISFFIGAVSGEARAQEESAEAPVADAPAADAAAEEEISLADVASRSEDLDRQVGEIESKRDPDRLDDAQEELSKLRERGDPLIERLETAIQAGSTSDSDALRLGLERIEKELGSEQESLGEEAARTRRMDRRNGCLRRALARRPSTRTRNRRPGGSPSPNRAQLTTAQGARSATHRDAQPGPPGSGGLPGRATHDPRRCRAGGSCPARARRSLWVRQHEPLWLGISLAGAGEGFAAVGRDLRESLSGAGRYALENYDRILVHFRLVHRDRLVAPATPPTQPRRIDQQRGRKGSGLRTAVSAALAVALILTPFLHPERTRGVQLLYVVGILAIWPRVLGSDSSAGSLGPPLGLRGAGVSRILALRLFSIGTGRPDSSLGRSVHPSRLDLLATPLWADRDDPRAGGRAAVGRHSRCVDAARLRRFRGRARSGDSRLHKSRGPAEHHRGLRNPPPRADTTSRHVWRAG